MGHSQQVVLQAFEAFPASHGHHITGPQTSIPLEATILGTIGTVFWSVQLIPQIYHSYRTKSTEGVPAIMMFLWATCGVPFGAYAIIQNFNIPLQVQPQIFCVFSMISWAQCMVYSRYVVKPVTRCVRTITETISKQMENLEGLLDCRDRTGRLWWRADRAGPRHPWTQ